MVAKVYKTEQQWKKQLTPEQFQVTRKKGNRTSIHREISQLQRERNLSMRLLR